MIALPRANALIVGNGMAGTIMHAKSWKVGVLFSQTGVTAAALAGTDQLQELLPKLYEIEFDAPQGRVKIEAKNNHAHLWPRVGKANARGTFDIVYDTGVRVEPDPFMLEYQLVPSEPADG